MLDQGSTDSIIDDLSIWSGIPQCCRLGSKLSQRIVTQNCLNVCNSHQSWRLSTCRIIVQFVGCDVTKGIANDTARLMKLNCNYELWRAELIFRVTWFSSFTIELKTSLQSEICFDDDLSVTSSESSDNNFNMQSKLIRDELWHATTLSFSDTLLVMIKQLVTFINAWPSWPQAKTVI